MGWASDWLLKRAIPWMPNPTATANSEHRVTCSSPTRIGHHSRPSLRRSSTLVSAQRSTTIMLPRLRQKRVYHVPLFSRTLSPRVSSVGPRLLVELNRNSGGNQLRSYAQQPPGGGGGFPSFSFQQQRNKGDALKEFVGSAYLSYPTAGDATRRRV